MRLINIIFDKIQRFYITLINQSKNQMPPKKKAPAKVSQNPSVQQKQASQVVVQTKQTTITTTPKPQSTQKKAETIKEPVQTQLKKQTTISSKIGIVPISKAQLTQAEILRQRRQKFRNPGRIVQQDDQKIKEERRKKFGALFKQSKDQIQERKRKFANPSSSILTEDQQILRQRRMKFSSNSNAIVTESQDILQERKKKFAKKEQNLISLDDEIQKAKQLEKSKQAAMRARRRISKPFSKKFRNKSGQHEKRFNSTKRSRKEVFGKKKFIKRYREKSSIKKQQTTV